MEFEKNQIYVERVVITFLKCLHVKQKDLWLNYYATQCLGVEKFSYEKQHLGNNYQPYREFNPLNH